MELRPLRISFSVTAGDRRAIRAAARRRKSSMSEFVRAAALEVAGRDSIPSRESHPAKPGTPGSAQKPAEEVCLPGGPPIERHS